MVDLQTSGWLSSRQDTLAKITANSGDEAFDIILDGEGGALALGGYRQKLSVTLVRVITYLHTFPAQQMLDLYLLGVYWLLLYDKVSNNPKDDQISVMINSSTRRMFPPDRNPSSLSLTFILELHNHTRSQSTW